MVGVAVIVPSFNRPNLLRQALDSIHADQVIVADDGSDFDVRSVVGGCELVQNPPIPPIERLRRARMGSLLNRALRLVQQPVVAYLNDDDLFAPDWLTAVTQFFDGHPEAHMCRGNWHIYGDDRDAFQGDWCVTTGNYAYRTTCATVEQCWWSENTVSAHDAVMLTHYFIDHGMERGGWSVPHLNVLAGWRREHPSNMAHFTQNAAGFTEGAAARFVLGARE